MATWETVVALPRFRRFDVQARYSLAISLASILPLAVAAYASFSRYDHGLRVIQFSKAGMFRPGFLACVALAGLLAVTGIVLGFNSAGQRRNDQERKSWAGFFIGMASCCLTIIVFAAFWFLKLPVVVGGPPG